MNMSMNRPVEANEIAQHLWMGSRPPPGPQLRRCAVDVVVLCAFEYQPDDAWYPGVRVERITLNDAELSGAEALEAFQLGAQLAREVKHRQRRVLITCSQGRNRSGLITALALTQLTGCSGLEACQLVRARRQSPFGAALTNHHYIEALASVPPARVRGLMTENAARAARLTG